MTTAVNNNQSIYDSLGLSRNNEPKVEETKQDQFMKLMVAQMQHQDPLEPQENGEFLSQLAQFETATGITALQDSFNQLSNSMQSNSALQASSLVGRNVLIPGGQSFIQSGDELNGKVDLKASTSGLNIEVLDSAGQTVRTIGLGEHPAGLVPFSWDGKNDKGEAMPAGKYSFKATSQVGNEQVAADVLVFSKVESVSMGAAGQSVKLNIAGMDSVSLSAVKEFN